MINLFFLIENCDIVSLLETFSHDGERNIVEGNFKFDIIFSFANIIESFSRFRGNSVYLVNKLAKNITVKARDIFTLFSINNNIENNVTYNLPVYLNFNNWKDNFERLVTLLNNNL